MLTVDTDADDVDDVDDVDDKVEVQSVGRLSCVLPRPFSPTEYSRSRGPPGC